MAVLLLDRLIVGDQPFGILSLVDAALQIVHCGKHAVDVWARVLHVRNRYIFMRNIRQNRRVDCSALYRTAHGGQDGTIPNRAGSEEKYNRERGEKRSLFCYTFYHVFIILHDSIISQQNFSSHRQSGNSKKTAAGQAVLPLWIHSFTPLFSCCAAAFLAQWKGLSLEFIVKSWYKHKNGFVKSAKNRSTHRFSHRKGYHI